MPSKQTPNYQLNQWEASDKVRRTDFNADNAKIDAAIAAKCDVAAGAYMGDGAASREINLGRKPKAVFLITESGMILEGGRCYGGVALPGTPVMRLEHPVLTVTDTGFTVYHCTFGSSSAAASNSNGLGYRYIALF